MAEETLPGEIDTEVIDFRDGPARRDYVIVKDVPILDEHLMTADHDNPEEWIGPERLQQIAANNNNRVNQTGDATPIIIGHTKDGLDERKQPPVVGFATNFVVHRLLNTQKQAIHADFHILKNELETVKNYPRRSVELWPKRWEIDPIALLGATTPERDLGLLQLSRWTSAGPERPRKYSRILDEEPHMAKTDEDDKKPKKKAADSEPDGDEGGSGGKKSKLSPEDIQAIIAALMETAPFKELLAAGGGGEGAPSPDGSDMGGDMGPGGPGGPPMAGDMMGGPGGPDGGHDPHSEAAFMSQGPPHRFEMDDDDGEGCPSQYAAGYGSANAGYMPSGHDMGHMNHMGHGHGGYVPYEGDAFYQGETMHPIPGAHQRPVQRSRTPEQIRYERWLEETGQVAPGTFSGPRYDPSLVQHDQRVRQNRQAKRQLSREQTLEQEVRKLQRKNTENERKAVLSQLQAEGYDFDLAEELGDSLDMSDAQFGKHVDRIKKRYSRDPASIRPVRPADDGRINPVRNQRSREEDSKLGQLAGGLMAQNPGMTFEEAKARIEKEQQGK